MKKRSGRLLRPLAVAAIVIALAGVFHAPVLNALARTLVREDPLKPCDAIVVLAGDAKGERLLAAVALWKKGYGKKIVFWGGPVYWKVTYAEMYLRLLKEYGIPESAAKYSEEDLKEVSTRGEAEIIMELLKKAGAGSFLLVTSDYHSARAAYVYSPLVRAHGMEMVVHPVKESNIHLDHWWKERASAKMVYLELEKSVWYRLQQLF